MGNRLSKIYTRTGDHGTTGLALGDRVAKSSARIEAIGDCDELNCSLGLALACDLPEPIRMTLRRLQNELFDLGGELAMPGETVVTDDYAADLEVELDALNDDLPPLKEFILPGGSEIAARVHAARAVCRRLERHLWALNEEQALNPASLRFINRLSDYLFVCARSIAVSRGDSEVCWQKRTPT